MAMAATTSSLLPRFGALPVMRHDHVGNPSDSHVRVRRSRGKRVTWASNDHLCQVRMFLAEDAPFLAGITQEQLQGKTTSFMHSAEDLPPGFGGGFGIGPANGVATGVGAAVSSCMKVDTEALVSSVVAAIPWKCPAKFEVDPQWLVETGEASSEVEVQKQRESTTLEAVYPRSSAIPSSPAEPEDQGFYVDDRQVPLIPVVAPDEDSDGEDSAGQGGGPPSVSAPASVVAYGVYNERTNKPMTTSYMNGTSLPGGVNNTNANNTNNNGIDTSLLLQLLANPSLVETLSGLRNKSMVNTPNGNAANHLLVPPRNQSVTGFTSSSSSTSSASQPAVVRNLTSLTPLTTTNTQSITRPSSPAPPSVGFPAPPVAPLGWQQHSVPPGFQHQYLNMNVNMNVSSSQQQQQQQQGNRNGEQYFKELIMQHGRGGLGGGGNGQQVQQHQQVAGVGVGGGGNGYVSNGVPPGFGLLGEMKGSKPRGLLSETTSSKPRKVCAYYNTAKGCRNGSKCPFLHDGKRNGAELNQNTVHHNKRMRS